MTTCLRLFVYGTLRRGFHNHRLIEAAKATPVARRDEKAARLDGDDPPLFFTAPAYTMRDLGSFPAVLKGGDTSIAGEVYLLPNEEAFKPLDRLEGHPTLYCREIVRLDDGTDAWIYVMSDASFRRSDPRAPEVSSGDWSSYVTGASADESSRTTYFAFGSNLLTEQMEERCKSAVFLTTARLRAHRLDFAGWSMKWQGGVATVTPCRGSSVLGSLWSLSSDDLSSLDRHEGHPTYYRRLGVEVDADDGFGRVRAWTYRLARALSAPSSAYLDALAEGRARLGFTDVDVLDAAVRADEAERKRADQRHLDLEMRARAQQRREDESYWRESRFVDGRAEEVQQVLLGTSDSPRVHPWQPKKKPRVVVRPRKST